jgi:bifunctional non-homologous end joining protein LigD
MALEKYRQKRDFRKTPEPKGAPARKAAWGPLSFVIQKHAASRLHYDFRLELEGVLKSWAVPKGPSLDPGVKRLAVHVEDHPLEYGSFEGIIPEGEYGGGTVLLWDRGRWLPESEPKEAYHKGKLVFTLDGEKLRGRWHLVRSRQAGADEGEGKEQWLLMKDDDVFAAAGSDDALLRDEPASAATGRTLEEVAAAGDRVWRSGEKGGGQGAGPVLDPAGAKGARRARLPERLDPELATLVDEAVDGDDWLHEIKFDGYRALGWVSGGRARILTRSGQDWTERFSALARELERLPVDEAVVDGEIVVLGAEGTSSFQALQEALSQGRQRDTVYYLFDLLYLDGYDVRGVGLEERKRLLGQLLPFSAAGPLRASEHVLGHGAVFHQEACRLGLEGIISKRRDSRYRGGRGRDWLKVKCQREQELVIGGFTDPSGSRIAFGALLLGVYDDDGALRYAGKVGTGFNDVLLRGLKKRLQKLGQATSPFANPPRERGVHWVRPELVAQVAFAEWTKDGNIRHPTFRGLREDKPAAEVRREDIHQARSFAGLERAQAQAEGEARPRQRAAKPGGPKETSLEGVRLSHPERVLYPGQGLTKLDLARYYESVAGLMVPLISHRPLMLVRCPSGTEGQCFFQKHANDQVPSSVARVTIPEKEQAGEYMYVTSLGGILTLLNLGALELHTWGARSDLVERPDRVIFDLDPDPSVGWAGVVELALEMKRRLDALGLESFPRTTGGKGVHVVVPLARRSSWDEVAEFARAFAARIAEEDPARYTLNMSKARRKGRIFIDYLRNARGATAVEAYSTRARPGAPVSTPVRWDEIGPRLKPDQWTVANFGRRLAALGGDDPWEGYLEIRQALTGKIMKAVAG